MIDHWKPLGGFIENTIRPLIEEMKWFLEELDKKEIKVNEDNIKNVTNHIFSCYLRSTYLHIFKALVITAMICFTFFKIYK